MTRLVAGRALAWFLVGSGALGAFAACDGSDEPQVAGEDAAGAGEQAGANAGGTATTGGTSAPSGAAGKAGSSAHGGNDAAGGSYASGGNLPASEGGAAGTDGSAGNADVAGAGAGAGAGGEAPCVPEPPTLPTDVPELIAAPEGTTLVRHFHAAGTQNYRCTKSAGDDPTYSWAFIAPVAELTNSCGVKVGRHFAVEGTSPPVPSWLYEVDGSSVNGARVDGSPVAGAIPELLLKESGHGGNGVFSTVTFVQRLDTAGGAAPAAATCNAEHEGEEQDIGYSAEYYFYTGGN
jgi:hypothetical protein